MKTSPNLDGRRGSADAATPALSVWGRLDRTGLPLLAARAALGGMFAWLAINKLLQDPHTFAKFVKMYGLLPQDPPELINAVTLVVPWLELACAAGLILGILLRGSALVSLLLLAVFTPAIYMHGLKLFNEGQFATLWEIAFDCGCGLDKQHWVLKLAENTGLMLAAAIVLASRSRAWCLSARLLGRRERDLQANLLAGGVVGGPEPASSG